MFNQADGGVILDLLVAPASAKIVVAVVSTRGSTGPRRGAERTALLISGLTPFQQAVDPTGGSTNCAGNLPLARMEIDMRARKPLGNVRQPGSGSDRRFGTVQHLGFCRPE
jgi:hypothetical protein